MNDILLDNIQYFIGNYGNLILLTAIVDASGTLQNCSQVFCVELDLCYNNN